MEYFDYAATTPVDPRVAEVIVHYMENEFGNSGSRTHQFGNTAKKAVAEARSQISSAINAEPDEVIFTSGATESNNICLLGLENYLKNNQKTHVISMASEHKAVLEPLQVLEDKGCEVTLLNPDQNGSLNLEELKSVITARTGLVSIMQVNNETGAIQPLHEIVQILEAHDCFFHVDAAQGFGKFNKMLSYERIDFISVSGHKIFGPKGVGALIARKRDYRRPPLDPLMFGGGQESGLRPGTLPVSLIAGLGKAAELSNSEAEKRQAIVQRQLESFESEMKKLDVSINAAKSSLSPYIRSVSIPGIDSEAAMVALKDLIAVSNGSACTSVKYKSSHVLESMKLSEALIDSTIRVSFSHLSADFDWSRVSQKLLSLKQTL